VDRDLEHAAQPRWSKAPTARRTGLSIGERGSTPAFGRLTEWVHREMLR
jgi:hypothetical protein